MRKMRADGQIGEGVFAAYEWSGNPLNGNLVRIYIGCAKLGPVLQYDRNGADKWTGRDHTDYPSGAWTACYSRGDYGRNYACGGHWSGHSLNIERSVGLDHSRSNDVETDCILVGNGMMRTPPGIMSDVTVLDMDCSGGWSIWHGSALDAWKYRLTPEQIARANLPRKCRELYARADQSALERVEEVIEAFGL